MPRYFFDPLPEEQNVVLVNAATLREAEKLIESILEVPAKCPNCRREIFEKTLVGPSC